MVESKNMSYKDQVEVHVSGQYIDCPFFAGFKEILDILKVLS